MATGTTRFCLTNLAVKASASSTYPALKTTPSALPNYPASNVLNPDRSVVWAVGAVSGAHKLIYDLGAAKDVDILGVHGYSVVYVMPSQVTVRAGNVYPDPGDGSWVGIAYVYMAGGRDKLMVLSEVARYRYWEFAFELNISGFSVGKGVLGRSTDLGIAFSAGSTDTYVRTRVSTPMVNGSQTKTETGRPYRKFNTQFLRVPQATRDALMAAAAAAPVSLLDPYDRSFEIDLDELTATAVWGSPDLYDIAFEAQSLP